MKYLINTPYISKLEKKYVNDVLDSGWLSINGFHTKIFEEKFNKFLGTKFTLAVQSGTAALHTALKALGVKQGDKIIIPNYTCVSNISVISQLNAVPIIVEVEKNSFGIDATDLEKTIIKYKPKVLQIVHVYGYPANDTLKIVRICKKYNVKILEDSSESLGAKINGKKVGNLGDVSIFSIRSEKMIGVGEGGVISTNQLAIFKKIKLIASRHAPFRKSSDPYWKKYFISGEGYNYLMPHLLGAVARAQIENFEKIILKKKIYIGETYKKIFSENENYCILQKTNKKFTSVHWLNSIYFKKLNKYEVRKLGKFLNKKKIEVRSGFWPLSKMNAFKSIKVFKNCISQDLFEKLLVLPSNINLTKQDLLYFKNCINFFLKNHKKIK
jgi:perosamine synthetase